MRLDQNIGHNRPGDEVRLLPFSARVLVLTDVSVRPPVERAFLERRDVFRHKVIADQIALLDRGPELFSRWIEREPNRVTSSARVDSLTRPVGIEFGDRCPYRRVTDTD